MVYPLSNYVGSKCCSQPLNYQPNTAGNFNILRLGVAKILQNPVTLCLASFPGPKLLGPGLGMRPPFAELLCCFYSQRYPGNKAKILMINTGYSNREHHNGLQATKCRTFFLQSRPSLQMVSKCRLRVLLPEGKHTVKRQLYSELFNLVRSRFFLSFSTNGKNSTQCLLPCILHISKHRPQLLLSGSEATPICRVFLSIT